MADLKLAYEAVEKIDKRGRHAATLISTDAILAMAELILLLTAKVHELDPAATEQGDKTNGS